MRLTLRAALLAVPLALVTTGTALAGNGGVAPVAPASPNASAIRDIYWLILGITGVIFVLVEAALILFVVKYRRGRRSREAEGAQVHGHTRTEVVWTVIPVLIVFAIIAFVFVKLPDVQDVPKASAANSLSVKVEGHQYYWLYRYPGGQISIDRMVVPTSTVVTLTVEAADVIHGWWIPALGGQIDAIPGRTNHTWFETPSQPGIYKGQCTQLCGFAHAHMLAEVNVVRPPQYLAFLAAHAPGSRAVAAEAYVGVCAKCHGMQGQGTDEAPPIAGGTFDEVTKELIRNGGKEMPAVGATWSEAQIDATIRYLNSTIGSNATSGGASG